VLRSSVSLAFTQTLKSNKQEGWVHLLSTMSRAQIFALLQNIQLLANPHNTCLQQLLQGMTQKWNMYTWLHINNRAAEYSWNLFVFLFLPIWSTYPSLHYNILELTNIIKLVEERNTMSVAMRKNGKMRSKKLMPDFFISLLGTRDFNRQITKT